MVFSFSITAFIFPGSSFSSVVKYSWNAHGQFPLLIRESSAGKQSECGKDAYRKEEEEEEEAASQATYALSGNRRRQLGAKHGRL